MKKIIWQWKEMLYRWWCQTNCLNLGEIPTWTLKGLISGGIPRDHSEISAFILWFWKGRMFFRKCNLHSWASQTAQWERTHLPMQRQGRCGFDPWVGKRPWERKWKPTPVFLPGEFHGERSLVGYTPWNWERVKQDWVRRPLSLGSLLELPRWPFGGARWFQMDIS